MQSDLDFEYPHKQENLKILELVEAEEESLTILTKEKLAAEMRGKLVTYEEYF